MMATTVNTTNKRLTIEELEEMKRKLEEERLFIFSNPENKEEIDKIAENFPYIEVKYTSFLPKEDVLMMKGNLYRPPQERKIKVERPKPRVSIIATT